MASVPSFVSLLTTARSTFLESASPKATPGAEFASTLCSVPGEVLPFQLLPAAQEALAGDGERLVRKARAHERSVAMLVMHLHDLAELELIFGSEAVDRAVRVVRASLGHVAGRDGLLVRAGTDTFIMLAPNVRSGDLMQALQQRLGPACCIEFEVDGEEIVLVPATMARTLRPSDEVERTYRRLCRAIDKTRRAERQREQLLRLERESYTLAADLPR